MAGTHKAFPISCESSFPLVASMRAARELSKDRNSGQSLFMPVKVMEGVRVDKRKEEKEEVRKSFEQKAKRRMYCFQTKM